jgi:hypothetical protein
MGFPHITVSIIPFPAPEDMQYSVVASVRNVAYVLVNINHGHFVGEQTSFSTTKIQATLLSMTLSICITAGTSCN